MFISDVFVKKPVFAAVVSLLLLAFGIVSFTKLSLREYPDIDPPVVSISVTYPGASAAIVESRVTEVLEERISGISGINFIESSSEDGRSRITLEFNVGYDIDAAANDVRDKISRASDDLPDEADPPEVEKVDSSDDVIIWLSLTSDHMTIPELTDYAERYLVDQYSVIDGVSQVRVSGAQTYAMRIWLDRTALAARGLTVNDVEDALRQENVELPAGSIESTDRQFTVRLQRLFRDADQFKGLVIGRGKDGYLVRLGDVARVERGAEENRTMYRGNGVPQLGLGIIKQSTANTISVARAAKAKSEELNKTLPDGMTIRERYDTSVFVEKAIHEVYVTLGIAVVLVVLVIYAFLGSWGATVIPAVAAPVSLVASFIVLLGMGFSINILTLLALILAIGLVVDDAIIVVENIVRRIKEEGETPLVAAYRGTKQVGFAVIATTLTLIAVFLPITFLEGDVGRLFSEFSVTMAASVAFSGVVALTLSPMLASKFLKKDEKETRLTQAIDETFMKIRGSYGKFLVRLLRKPVIVIVGFAVIIVSMVGLFKLVPSEYTPLEDRGAIIIMVNGPEGATYSYMKDYMDEVEERLQPYIQSGEIESLIIRAPRSFGTTSVFNSGLAIAVLSDWGSGRRNGFDIVDSVRKDMADMTGVRISPIMRQGFTSSVGKPVQFVIGGGTYEELREWRDILLAKINENNPGLNSIDWNYKETKPQLEVLIDYDRAASLGVTVTNIGETLETMLGSRRVTTYVDSGEEYDVIMEGEREEQRTATNMENIYVRSDTTGALIPLSNLVKINEFADSATLSRYNRLRAITIEANLDQGYTLGAALDYLEKLAKENLPETAVIDYKGQSQDYKYSGGSIYFVFLLGILVTYLVMAAQFESFVHPFVILLTVPLAMAGALAGLYVMGQSLNIFTQIGLIMLVGLAAKNGILIVEFVNQLRDEGVEFHRALIMASELRLRPILMTSITAMAGAVPLILTGGAGSETRSAIGIVIFFGVAAATFFTLFVVPAAYQLISRRTGSPLDVTRRLEREIQETPER
ncbi:MAG: multidrug transporter AcrB [Micavibrio aeruginosavorus]|uniref:Multidrug transporter AcrB n=1 Tax=Micavibrio aeruginosavorus TaxID=349221 RepID=A0A2W5N203_9BACT|nr:MAG: multidrug transporter AcrB [Micavibrio aeruginosavorus]